MAESSTPGVAAQRPYQTKLVLLGEAAVGKSSVVLRFVSNDFQENKEPTIGAAFLTQKCRLEDRVIKFEIWDTAGQERFHSLAPMYYRNAQASAVIYDVTKASSFEKAKSWVKELQRQANPNIVIALVGNKIDLLSSSTKSTSTPSAQEAEEEDDDEDDGATTTGAAESSSASLRAVPKEEATAYAKELGLLFFETSAKTGEGVTEVFTEIAKRIKIEAQNKDAASGAGSRNGGSGANGSGNANRVDIARGGNNDGNNKEACAC